MSENMCNENAPLKYENFVCERDTFTFSSRNNGRDAFVNFAVPSHSPLNPLGSRGDATFAGIADEPGNSGSRVRPFLSWMFSFPCFSERRHRGGHYAARK